MADLISRVSDIGLQTFLLFGLVIGIAKKCRTNPCLEDLQDPAPKSCKICAGFAVLRQPLICPISENLLHFLQGHGRMCNIGQAIDQLII